MKKLLIICLALMVASLSVVGLVSCDDGFYVPAPPWTDIGEVETLAAVVGLKYVYPSAEHVTKLSVWSEKHHKSYKARQYDEVSKVCVLGVKDGREYELYMLKSVLDYDYCTREYDVTEIKFGGSGESVGARAIPSDGVISRFITYEFFFKRMFYQVNFTLPKDEELSAQKVAEVKESARDLISEFKLYE